MSSTEVKSKSSKPVVPIKTGSKEDIEYKLWLLSLYNPGENNLGSVLFVEMIPLTTLDEVKKQLEELKGPAYRYYPDEESKSLTVPELKNLPLEDIAEDIDDFLESTPVEKRTKKVKLYMKKKKLDPYPTDKIYWDNLYITMTTEDQNQYEKRRLLLIEWLLEKGEKIDCHKPSFKYLKENIDLPRERLTKIWKLMATRYFESLKERGVIKCDTCGCTDHKKLIHKKCGSRMCTRFLVEDTLSFGSDVKVISCPYCDTEDKEEIKLLNEIGVFSL